MTAKERARLARLETENARLREQLDKQAKIYREQLYELVALKTTIELVSAAMEGAGMSNGDENP